MTYEKLNQKGRAAYQALGACVRLAVQEKDPEYAVLCGSPLTKLAEVEAANYFGTQGEVNNNTAFDLIKDAVNLAEDIGVPYFLKEELSYMQQALNDLDPGHPGWWKEKE